MARFGMQLGDLVKHIRRLWTGKVVGFHKRNSGVLIDMSNDQGVKCRWIDYKDLRIIKRMKPMNTGDVIEINFWTFPPKNDKHDHKLRGTIMEIHNIDFDTDIGAMLYEISILLDNNDMDRLIVSEEQYEVISERS